MKLHYETAGDPTSPSVLMIHGFMSSNRQWDLNVAALSEHLHLVMVELWGHGASPAPADDDDTAFELANYLTQFEAIRTELNLDTWWVIGQSLGGAFALRYALAFPERIHGVVFTNSRSTFALARADGRTVEELTTDGDLRRLPYHPIHAKRFPPDLQQRMVDAADAMTPATLQRTVANRASVSSRDDFGEISVPVLLVNGTWEKKFQPVIDLAKAALPSLQVVHLEGGHSINIEDAPGFDAAVLAFTGHSPENGTGR